MRKWDFYTAKELKPTGWLLRQLKLQAQGLSGNLDKVWPDVRDSAWIGGDREGWERVPYWLDGFIPLAYLLEDEDMISRAKKHIYAILQRQQPDGWICPCSKEKRATYDTWAVQLIAKVLTMYYQCSRDETIPPALYKLLENYYELLKKEEIHLFMWGKFRWFELFISLEFLYEKYPEPWILELGRLAKDQGANYEEMIPQWQRPLNKWTLETHIVNLTMMLKQEAVSCRLLGESYTDLAEKLYQVLKTYHGTAVETFTGDECLSGVSPIQGTELCAVVEQMYSYEWLYAATGDPKWAQRLEVLSFNALPAAISEDMWTHQYVQMNNQIACEKFPGKSLFRTNNAEAHLFGLEPHYGCCTANFNQGWPKLALSAFLHRGDRIISALPLPCRLEDESVSVELETNYPFETTLHYRMEAKKDITFEIRVPGDARNVQINGKSVAPEFFLKAGTRQNFTVTFTVTPRFEKYPYGLHYVRWGSLVFALPVEAKAVIHEYEQRGVVRKFPYCDYELIPQSDWNYGFADKTLTVVQRSVGQIPFSRIAPVSIKARLQKIPWGLEDGYETVCAKVPESRVPISGVEEKELIPYGCAKLRMTVMPFVSG